jgi:uncharacterized membrane protein
MEKVVVIVFNDKANAYECSSAIEQLDSEGEISLLEMAIVLKDGDGSVHIERAADSKNPLHPAVGTVVWSVFGLLGSSINVGSLIGGGLLGSISDMEAAGISSEFVREISNALNPGRVAVVADMMEEQVTPVDSCVEALRGTIFRRMRDRIGTTEEDRDVDAYASQLKQLKSERSEAKDSHQRAKLDSRTQEVELRLDSAMERRRAKAEVRVHEREQKIRTLQQKAVHAKGEIKSRQASRIAELLDV